MMSEFEKNKEQLGAFLERFKEGGIKSYQW